MAEDTSSVLDKRFAVSWVTDWRVVCLLAGEIQNVKII